jgi:photosystem II stability/assembly factor-like uncharacterized protein
VLRRIILGTLIVWALAPGAVSLPAQQASPPGPSLFAEMRWRAIGPSRGGRTKSAAGHVTQPFTFYIGVCNGGVWKTTDAGRTWKPIFDDQPTGSIGSVVVAPSDASVIYVGSGEGLARPDLSVGDGLYKSMDAGVTWTHLGLRDAQQIPNIAVDPKNANRLFVAAFGHPYGPSKDRGIYRSNDGGQTFQAVLQKDENVGGNDVDIDPSNPDVVYATLWEERQGPWEDAQWRGNGGGIYKSVDGGTTWKQLTNGLPGDGNITQANLAIAPSNPKRLYAAVAAAPSGDGGGRGAGGAAGGGGRGGRGGPGGATECAPGSVCMFRSDDAGDSWTLMNGAGVGRIGGGDLAVPVVDPQNPDVVYTANTVSYKSTDAGRTWAPFKGAPGGDDYQNLWINPTNPNIILLVSDQGAVVSLNGGQSWSSWYNQPTAQLYHVNADNDFPYRVCSGQQESGSACVSSRGNDGQITFREWHPVGVEEYGYAVPDPKDPNLVFGGKVTRYNRATAQVASVSPTGGGRGGGPTAGPPARAARTQPLVFSAADPHVLFYGNNVLWKTIDNGLTWKQISPDFARPDWDLPKSIGKYMPAATQHGAPNGRSGLIYSIAPSPLDVNRIWAGTDDGQIKLSIDGGLHWADVTPKALTPYMKVFNMDASHFDAGTAYAAVNTLRLDDMRPHLFRTRDGGATWTEIVNGLDAAGPTSTIREDPKKKGLLFAGSERQVYVSFDDGDDWQSLRLNMGASSVRDLTIHDDDLIAATHGRGFWILDDITPLRQIDATSASQAAILFKPSTAWRVRWNTNTDTPLPPDEGNLQNPPEGAVIDYYLKSAAAGPLTLEVFGADNRLVRRYSSSDPAAYNTNPGNLPSYWYRPVQTLSTAAGMHRFSWDVHYQPLDTGGGGGRGGLPIAAVPYNTAPASSTPWVGPGQYTVKLTVDGRSYTQPIVVKSDPRVKTPALTMQQVYSLTKSAYYGAIDAQQASQQAQHLRDQIGTLQPQAKGEAAAALDALDKKIVAALTPAAAPAPEGQTGRAAGSQAAPPGAAPGPAAGRGGGRGGRGGGAPGGGAANALTAASTSLAGVMNSLQGADVQPTANQLKAMTDALQAQAAAMARWRAVKTVDVPAANLKLKAAGLTPIDVQ